MDPRCLKHLANTTANQESDIFKIFQNTEATTKMGHIFKQQFFNNVQINDQK